MAKTYKSIVKKKLLKEIFYQIEFFGKKLWMNAKKALVLAAGTSAGKTLTSLIQLEIFYSMPENAKKLTLILSSSTTVLRDNFAIALEQFNPSFSYYVVSNKKELEEAIKDGYQVIVCLPQTLNNNYKLLPKVTNFILDEAHQWYFKPTIQKIIKHCKPTRQLLLTGTPSRFNAKANDFEFYYVPVMDLYENDLVSNIKIEVVSSSYDFKQDDWKGTYGPLKQDKTNSPTKSKEAFKMVCDEMILKLRGRLGNKYLANLRGANKISALFNDLKKTIIFCHSLKQANAFYKELSSMKGLNDMVLLSHSENDKNSNNFEMFRTDNQYKVLVAVDRGKLGYNLPDLFNVVDFSMTQSLDMILQMMGRILRLSDKDNEKIYFKVATKNTAGYFVDLMTAALCLFKMEWYSKFNGKNMGGILIPKVKTTRPKSKGKSTPTNKKKKTQRITTLEELGIPLDLNLFNQSILYSQGDKFSTVAWTTLDDVRREFFDISYHDKGNTPYTKEQLIDIADNAKTIGELGYQTIKEFEKKCINSGNCYGYNGKKLFNEITKHIPRQFVWTKNEIEKDFKLNTPKSVSAYSHTTQGKKAKELGIFDRLTKDLPLGRVVWTDKMLEEACLSVNSYNEMVETEYGIKAYGKLRTHKNKKFITKCLSHWEGFHNGRRFEWNKSTAPLFWKKVKELGIKTKNDLRNNNLREPARKLGVYNQFEGRIYNKK